MILKQRHDDRMAQQLMEALEEKDFARFSELLPSAKKGDGGWAMEVAIDLNSLEYVKILIPLCHEGALGGNCIVDAAMYGHTNLVREFLPYANTDTLHVALNSAITHKNESTVVLLLEHVDATYEQSYPLQLAASKIRRHEDCPIFNAVFAAGNPQEALDALHGRLGKETAMDILQERINFETKRKIDAHIGTPTTVHTRKM